jgi:hypothetical protein
MQAERTAPKYHAKYKVTGEIVPVFAVDPGTRTAEVQVPGRPVRTVVPSSHLSSFTAAGARS